MPGIEDFISALESDSALSEKISAVSTPDAAVDIAKAAGYDISAAELMEAYKTKMAGMTEDQLANVAGGKGDKKSNQQSGDGGSQVVTDAPVTIE